MNTTLSVFLGRNVANVVEKYLGHHYRNRASSLVFALANSMTAQQCIWIQKMGKSLDSPRRTRMFLSRIYCSLKNKPMPSICKVKMYDLVPKLCYLSHKMCLVYPWDNKSILCQQCIDDLVQKHQDVS
jgi:hypothetical protein